MQQTYHCPVCRAPVASGTRFCGNCGISLNWPAQQHTQQSTQKVRATSGWAKFGKVLLILGILCIVIGPLAVLVMAHGEFDAINLSLIVRSLITGVLNISVGLSLMRRG